MKSPIISKGLKCLCVLKFHAATGICVVPLTSFFSSLLGFRMTLLDKDEAEFEYVVKTIAEKITEYINSAKTSLQTSINLS